MNSYYILDMYIHQQKKTSQPQKTLIPHGTFQTRPMFIVYFQCMCIYLQRINSSGNFDKKKIVHHRSREPEQALN